MSRFGRPIVIIFGFLLVLSSVHGQPAFGQDKLTEEEELEAERKLKAEQDAAKQARAKAKRDRLKELDNQEKAARRTFEKAEAALEEAREQAEAARSILATVNESYTRASQAEVACQTANAYSWSPGLTCYSYTQHKQNVYEQITTVNNGYNQLVNIYDNRSSALNRAENRLNSLVRDYNNLLNSSD